MVNYQNAKVYKLVSNVPGDDNMYIGSTSTTLAKRMATHRTDARSGKNRKVCTWMRDAGIENVSIVLVEDTPCENYGQQRMHERRWVEELQPSLNMLTPYLSREEKLEQHKRVNDRHYEQNRSDYIERAKKYYEQNQDKIREYKKNYSERNRARIMEKKKLYYEQNKRQIAARCKQQYEQNKRQIAERSKQYCERNRDKIREYKKQYYERNKEVLKSNFRARHAAKKAAQQTASTTDE